MYVLILYLCLGLPLLKASLNYWSYNEPIRISSLLQSKMWCLAWGKLSGSMWIKQTTKIQKCKENKEISLSANHKHHLFKEKGK